MIRALYAGVWLVAAPLAALRLLWRARRQPGYARRIGERFGRYATAAGGAPVIWVHAVSVGETRAAAPIVAALQQRFPGHRVLLTHMTPTGRETGEALFGDRVERAWLPYDLRFAVRRFLAHWRPRFGIVLETELWPRLFEEARAAGVPVLLVNARLSPRSARRYARVPSLARWALGNLAGVAAQTPGDAQRLEALGAAGPAVTGNVKFDADVPQQLVARGLELRRALGPRPVWVAGSTREGEEALLLEAFVALPASAALLVIVPRHPQRFDEVAALARSRGLGLARRSDAAAVGPEVRVLLGDSMGEMPAYYAAADVVVMGGSLLPFGSQNLIEACAVGRPVIVGPHTYNFEDAAEGAIAAGGALRVAGAREALEAAAALSRDAPRREAMGERARSFVEAHRGAVGRLAEWIEAAVARAEASAPGRG